MAVLYCLHTFQAAEEPDMTIEVNLTAEEFKRFTLFDTFHKRKMWRSPVIFAGILCFCALICFLMRHMEGAAALGGILLLIGLGMPVSYFATFFSTLRRQVKSQCFPMKLYTLRLSETPKGIHVENDQEQADYAWKDVFHVYCGETAAYLYMTRTQSFLLPYSCVEEGSQALWELIKKQLTAEQYSFLTKR